MEQFFNDLLQRAEQYSLQSVRVRDAGGGLVGVLTFARNLSTRQIKGALREISSTPGRDLASAVALPGENGSGLPARSCQVTVEERMQLFGNTTR